MPVDDYDTADEFMRVRAALASPADRAEAVKRFARAYQGSATDQQALQTSAQRALDTFAVGGLQAISRFLETNVPPAEQQRAADIVIRLLGSAIHELRGLVRERAGHSALSTSTQQLELDANWS
jgi:cytochrome c biogenesis protein